MSDAAEDLIRRLILPKLQKVRRGNGGWTACCPAHEDSSPSLSVGVGDRKDKPVLHCHAGCTPDAILDALSLSWDDLKTDGGPAVRAEWTPYGDAVAVYDYVGPDGKLIFQVLRTADKKFPQRVPDTRAKSGWRWSISGIRPVLYRLPKVLQAVADGEVVYVLEGERDVHSAEGAGVVATCSPGGAGKWRNEYAKFLAGAIVVVVADRDEPGRKHARQVAASLDGGAAAVEIREAAEGKDLTDHLAAGLTLADLVMTWQSGGTPVVELSPDLVDFISGVDPPVDWVIPDILERGDRLIWTGREGLGKSMIMRQLAVGAAAGLHPLSLRTSCPQEPRRVLYIDCENPMRISRKHFRILADIAAANGKPLQRGFFHVIHRSEGLDFVSGDDAAWLAERVVAHKPDFLIIGPLYKLHNTDMNEEQSARALIAAIDSARAICDCAVAIEAHAGHGESDSRRPVRPAGSSLLLRWPEFGFGIVPHGDPETPQPRPMVKIRAWRGPRAERAWPELMQWGSPPEWPWVSV